MKQIIQIAGKKNKTRKGTYIVNESIHGAITGNNNSKFVWGILLTLR